ncbi:MAG TPA: HAD family phosphatase [Gaiellaceae bacterium]|nr:HAD family phosphatase [Gaiellaceae bacterium]
MIEAVVFDLDGVIVDSEQVWDEVRIGLVRESGRPFPERATRDMMGMSSPEWSRYLTDTLGVPGTPESVNAEVVRRLLERYADRPPLIRGAVAAVRRIGARWPLAIASSSNPEVIEVVLRAAGIEPLVQAAVSSEQVGRGKPAPDVYLEAVRRLGVEGANAAAVEDSHNGIRSAKAAGLRVVAIPNHHFPPDEESLALADVVVASIDELTVEVVAG